MPSKELSGKRLKINRKERERKISDYMGGRKQQQKRHAGIIT